MEKLAVITEKKSVADDIRRVLGGFEVHGDIYESDRYVIVWAIGHILGFQDPEEINPEWRRWTLGSLPMIPERFNLKPLGEMEGRIKLIHKVLERNDIHGIVNACDAGREGELIFREIIAYTGVEKPLYRLWLQSMTPDSIREGFANLQDSKKFDGLADAAWSRSEADWLVGMNATRAVTKRLQTRSKQEVWSAGRVQTPTLTILVDHEAKILDFEPQPYWQIKGKFKAFDHEYEGIWYDPDLKSEGDSSEKDDRIFDQARAREILEQIAHITGTELIQTKEKTNEIEFSAGHQEGFASETRKPSRESAPLLFDLTTLQREANRRMGFSARRTLQAAQRLYEEHKVLTYPRTDSKHLPEDYRNHVHHVLQVYQDTEFGSYTNQILQRGLLNQEKIFNNNKVSDHFAIIPTGVKPGNLQGDDRRIFDLVMRRFLSAFFPPAIWNQVERKTQVKDFWFRTNTRTLLEAGWRAVYGRDDEEQTRLPQLVTGQDESKDVLVKPLDYVLQEKTTNPPARITEGRLLGLMERAGRDLEDEALSEAMGEKGLGTPATRADIIENLISKGYVLRLKNGLKPTAKGIRLVDFLHRIDAAGLTSAELTGEWEKNLRDVEHGKLPRVDFMKGISTFTRDIVEKIKEFGYDDLYAQEEAVGPCPMNPSAKIREFLWGYRCENSGKEEGILPGCPDNCSFIVWKEINGRYINRKAVTHLLSERKTPPLTGFVARNNQEYEASLILDENNQVKLVTPSEQGEETTENTEEIGDVLGPCPVCQESQIIETSLRYVCQGVLSESLNDRKKCTFVLPKVICQREISKEEAQEYLTQKRTPFLKGFISKRGREFIAALYLKENGKHGFEFQQREGRSSVDATPKTKRGTRKKTTSKKTSTKKTAVKKTATRKSSTTDQEG